MIANDKALVKAGAAYQQTAVEPVAKKRGLFAFMDPLWRLRDERSLKRTLNREFRNARDFQSNGLPVGSLQYRQIHRRSCDALAGFCSRWDMSLEDRAREVPALYGLQMLAYPEKKISVASKVIGILLLALAVAAAIGALTGTIAGAHNVMRRLIGG